MGAVGVNRTVLRPEVEYWEQLPDVAKPFPFTEPWVWEGADESHEGAREQVTAVSSWARTAAVWTGT
jgi:hypothetical protein